MGLMDRVLKNLLPPGGSAWYLAPTFRTLVEGLALTLDRAKGIVDSIVDESLPSTAEDMLPEWFAMFGIPYDSTLALATRQAIARQAYTAVGGQSLDSLQDALERAHPELTISTVTPDGHKYYNLSGYTDAETLDRALGLLERIAPAEMEPHVDVITFIRTTPDGSIRTTPDGSIRGGR